MESLNAAVRRFAREEVGATMVEYAIMLALIAAVCIAAIKLVGGKTNNSFDSANTLMP